MSRRSRIVRTGLMAGVLVLAVILPLSRCGTVLSQDVPEGERGPRRNVPVVVPADYDKSRGWDVNRVYGGFAVAPKAGSIATLRKTGDGGLLLRALNVTNGRTRWTSPGRKPDHGPGSGSWTRPRLFEVTAHGREFFVVASYGDVGTSVLKGPKKVVALDVYDAAYGTARHFEVPWSEPPDVTGGPGILIGRGSDHAAVVDPATGVVKKIAAKDLKYPKKCADCHHETEVRGLTAHGLLVRGAGEFWVRGGWHGRRTAPKGTDPDSGLPTSVTAERVLVRWHKKAGSKDAADLETWAVHDADTGRVLASADCHRPAIEPGKYPEMALSFSGRYVVAGPLALDLEKHTGHCYDASDHPAAGAADPDDPAVDHGPRPLTLTTVTDDGIAYGTTSAHGADGRPLQVTLATATVEPLAHATHLPAADVGGYGLFPYTDSVDIRHLVGHPHQAPAD